MRYLFKYIIPLANRFKLQSNVFFYVTIGMLFIFIAILLKNLLIEEKKSKSFFLYSYFFLIGSGFIIIELFLIQRLSIILGNPIINSPFIFLAIFLSCSIGGFFSKKINSQKSNMLILINLITISILTFFLGFIMQNLWIKLYQTVFIKYFIIFLIIFTMSSLLGLLFTLSVKYAYEKIAYCLAMNAFGYVWGGFLFLAIVPTIGYSQILNLSGLIYLISAVFFAIKP